MREKIIEAAGWALCAKASGAGKDKGCDLEDCVCGREGEAAARGVLSAIEALGYVIVPREPTPEMIAAAWDGISLEKPLAGISRLGPGPGTTDVYRAMIEAGKV